MCLDCSAFNNITGLMYYEYVGFSIAALSQSQHFDLFSAAKNAFVKLEDATAIEEMYCLPCCMLLDILAAYVMIV